MFYWGEVATDIEIPYNSRYCYSLADRIEFSYEWEDSLSQCGIRDINFDIILKFQATLQEFFGNLNRYWEKFGYDFLYNITDEDYDEMSDVNGWEYLENGEFYIN